jgi:hypothetical protein
MAAGVDEITKPDPPTPGLHLNSARPLGLNFIISCTYFLQRYFYRFILSFLAGIPSEKKVSCFS